MGGGGKHTSNTHVVNYENEDVTNTHNNVKNLENHYKEHNLQTNIHNGDRALGGAVNIMNDVNSGTAIYKLNLQNLMTLEEFGGMIDYYGPTAQQYVGAASPYYGEKVALAQKDAKIGLGIAQQGMGIYNGLMGYEPEAILLI